MARQPRTKKPKLTPAQVEALDRDENGEAGGSKPKATPDEAAVEERGEVSSAPGAEHQADPIPSPDGARLEVGKRGLAKRLGSHEFDALCAEAYEAYDYQAERVRFDSIGRKWTFRPDKIGQGESVLSLEVRLLDSLRLEYISTAILASDLGRDMVTDVVKAMAEAL